MAALHPGPRGAVSSSEAGTAGFPLPDRGHVRNARLLACHRSGGSRVVGVVLKRFRPAIGMRILVIGACSVDTKAMLNRLAKRGWGSRTMDTLREGRELLETFQFDLILSSESLPDGRGYEMSEMVRHQSGTLLVGIALSETQLWLPVVERGQNVLGKRALNASLLESEAQKLLGGRDTQTLGEISRRVPMPSGRPVSKHNGVPRRNKAAA